MLALPALVPILNLLVGAGYRMDHLPLTIIQPPNGEGFDFHGGCTAAHGEWNEVSPVVVRMAIMLRSLLR